MSWHLDKNVTIGVITALLLNSGSLIWGAAQLSTKIENLGSIPSRMTEAEERILILETETRLMRGSFGEFKQTMNSFNNTITRIDKEQAKRETLVYGKKRK